MTRQQKKLLDIIYLAQFPLSFQEMADRMGFKSKSSIHTKIIVLEEGGYITRTKMTRSIELTQKGYDYLDMYPAEELHREYLDDEYDGAPALVTYALLITFALFVGVVIWSSA